MASIQTNPFSGLPSSPVPLAVLRTGWLRRVGVPLTYLAAGTLGYLFATGAGEPEIARISAAVAGVLALVSAATYWRRRAILQREWIETRGLLRTGRVRYDELEGFTYDARSYRLYLFVPLGRVAQLKLWGRTAEGRRARAVLNAGFARFDAFVPIAIDLAVAAIVKRMRATIGRGEQARFGRRIFVGTDTITVRRPVLGEDVVPLHAITIEVDDGAMTLSTADRELGRFALKATPNLLALPQLLEDLSAVKGRPRSSALHEALAWRPPKS